MEGTVLKLEAALNNTYADDRYVIGTKVTIQHEVDGQKNEVVRVTSIIFMPPNSVLPNIGDVVGAGVLHAVTPAGLPEGGDEG